MSDIAESIKKSKDKDAQLMQLLTQQAEQNLEIKELKKQLLKREYQALAGGSLGSIGL